MELQGISTDLRTFHDLRLLQDVLDLARRRGKIALFETGDLIFEPALVQYDSYYRSLTPPVAQEYLRHIHFNLEMLKRCDYALTTTGYLAHALQQHTPALVNRNAVGVEDQDWVAHFCIAAALGWSISIYGNGKQVRDVLWIEDLVRAYDLATENMDVAAGKVYNIGAGHPRSGCTKALRDSGAGYVRIRRCSRASCQRLWYDWISVVTARLCRHNP